MNMRLFTLLLLGGAAPAASAVLITVTNGDFQTDVGQASTVATGWTAVNGAGTNNPPSNYFQNDISGFTGDRLALLKSDGGNYIQQDLSTGASGAVDATSFNGYIVNFNYGYRRDSTTNGDLTLRVSLWNTTDNLELAGQNFTITNPGTGANSMSAQVANLSYDNTQASLFGDTIALRITNTTADLAGNAWQRTGMVDDFTVTAVPEPSAYALFGAGSLAAIAFVRRRKRAR